MTIKENETLHFILGCVFSPKRVEGIILTSS